MDTISIHRPRRVPAVTPTIKIKEDVFTREKVNNYRGGLYTAYRKKNKNRAPSPAVRIPTLISHHQQPPPLLRLSCTRNQRVHKWTDTQREIICVLRRWYTNSWQEITDAWNLYFSENLAAAGEQPLSTRKIISQWNDMRSFGLDSAWQLVYIQTTFEDPEGRWAASKRRLERITAELNTRLRPATEPTPVPKPNPRSPYYQKRMRSYKKKLRSAKQQAQTVSTIATVSSSQAVYSENVNGILNQLLQAAQVKKEEVVPLQKIPSLPLESYQKPIYRRPHFVHEQPPAILYRVYYEKSAGYNSCTGMRAGFFTQIPNCHIPKPLDDKELQLIFAAKHLWLDQYETRIEQDKESRVVKLPDSPFLSCDESLIFVMTKAHQLEKAGYTPVITVVDASVATADGRGFRANDLAVECKRRGYVGKMYYKAWTEWLTGIMQLIWGEISEGAILYTLTMDDLRSVATEKLDVSLTAFRHNASVMPIRRALLSQNNTMSGATSYDFGRLAATFGFTVMTESAMLSQFVYNVAQGWALAIDDDNENNCAYGFTEGIQDATGDEADNEQVLNIRAAFIDGARKAGRDLARQRS